MVKPFRSLASAVAGERLAIRRIRSTQAAELCKRLGMCEGDAVECRANTASRLLLRTPSGKVISLEHDWARYVQIETAENAENRDVTAQQV